MRWEISFIYSWNEKKSWGSMKALKMHSGLISIRTTELNGFELFQVSSIPNIAFSKFTSQPFLDQSVFLLIFFNKPILLRKQTENWKSQLNNNLLLPTIAGICGWCLVRHLFLLLSSFLKRSSPRTASTFCFVFLFLAGFIRHKAI